MNARAGLARSGDIRLEWPVDRVRSPQGEFDLEIRAFNVAERPVVIDLMAVGELSSPDGEPLETSLAYAPASPQRQIAPGESLLVPVVVPALKDAMVPRTQDEIGVEDRADSHELELPPGEYLVRAHLHGHRSAPLLLEVVDGTSE